MPGDRKDETGKSIRSKSPDQNRTEAMAKYQASSVSLMQELEAMYKNVKFHRECLEKNQISGMGYKQEKLDAPAIKAVGDLSLALTRLVDAKIKFDKHLKKCAEESTPEDDRATVVEYFKSLEWTDRRDMLKEFFTYHNSQVPHLNARMDVNV